MFDLENVTWSDMKTSIEDDLMFGSNSSFTNVSDFALDSLRNDKTQLDVVYAVMEVLVAFFAVTGNAIVITVFLCERKLRRRTNYYIFSLALADFLVGLLGIPFAILISVGIPQNYTACLLLTSLLLSFCTISIFSLVLISIDRFMSILFPMKYCEDKSYVISEILVCWILGLLIGFLPFAWHEDQLVSKCFYHEIVCESYQMFRFVCVVLVPFCIISTIYAMIYRVVLQQLKHENVASFFRSSRETQTRLNTATRREIKATMNIFVIVLFFTICWLPLNTIKTVKILCESCSFPNYFITFGIILTHFNSAVNPFLYAYHLRDFRHAICALFRLRRRESSLSF